MYRVDHVLLKLEDVDTHKYSDEGNILKYSIEGNTIKEVLSKISNLFDLADGENLGNWYIKNGEAGFTQVEEVEIVEPIDLEQENGRLFWAYYEVPIIKKENGTTEFVSIDELLDAGITY